MSVRRIHDDQRLRPFLSSHFDPASYLAGVIAKSESQKCYNEVTSCIDEVSVEIKDYITEHKDELMSGMQDVAILASRYQTLSSTSDKLKRSIERMKKDALDSHGVIKAKTLELSRIHEANALLRQLRQFVHAKSQLDHHMKAAADHEGRSVAEVFKPILDMLPQLRERSVN